MAVHITIAIRDNKSDTGAIATVSPGVRLGFKLYAYLYVLLDVVAPLFCIDPWLDIELDLLALDEP